MKKSCLVLAALMAALFLAACGGTPSVAPATTTSPTSTTQLTVEDTGPLDERPAPTVTPATTGAPPPASTSPASADAEVAPARAAATTTTTTAPRPPTTGQNTPRPSAPRYRVHCPDGRTLMADTEPTMEQMRELCDMAPKPTATSSPPPAALPQEPSQTHRIICPDGQEHVYERLLSDEETRELCGIPPATTTTTTTTVPLPQLIDVQWSNPDGTPAGGFCVIPPDDSWRDTMPEVNWCPPPGPRSYRWTATYDNGETLSGVTPELNPGDTWSERPNDWNGTLTVSQRENGASFSAGWD
jgi:hypothetical protein